MHSAFWPTGKKDFRISSPPNPRKYYSGQLTRINLGKRSGKTKILFMPNQLPPIQHFLIDGSYLVWRSFLATPALHAPDGFPTNAIHGFLGAVGSALKSTGHPACHVAWDGGSAGRSELIETYKQNRQKCPSELSLQIPVIDQLCQLLGWQTVRSQGYEADDVLYTWVKSLGTANKAIFTTDKDLISLVDESTFIYERQKGKIKLLDQKYYTEKWGFPPSRIPDFLALQGDKIDGIPGVRGLGAKTATKLLQEFTTLEEILQAAATGRLKEREQRLVSENLEQIHRNRQAVQLQTAPAGLHLPEARPDEAANLLLSLGMVKTAEKLTAYKPRSGEPSATST
jgi:DNA polymerase-1